MAAIFAFSIKRFGRMKRLRNTHNVIPSNKYVLVVFHHACETQRKLHQSHIEETCLTTPQLNHIWLFRKKNSFTSSSELPHFAHDFFRPSHKCLILNNFINRNLTINYSKLIKSHYQYQYRE